MSILTSLTLPLAASTARSSAGPSVLQGPHQVAQKSTITGCVREASMTSLAKPASLPSLIRSPPGAVSPISDIDNLLVLVAPRWDLTPCAAMFPFPTRGGARGGGLLQARPRSPRPS